MYVNNTIKFNTDLGNRYTYEVYLITGTEFYHVPGNYMFAYQRPDGWWQVLYVGKTEDFAERFSNHHKLDSAIRYGATHILTHINANEIARSNEEFEMINWLKPRFNTQIPKGVFF